MSFKKNVREKSNLHNFFMKMQNNPMKFWNLRHLQLVLSFSLKPQSWKHSFCMRRSILPQHIFISKFHVWVQDYHLIVFLSTTPFELIHLAWRHPVVPCTTYYLTLFGTGGYFYPLVLFGLDFVSWILYQKFPNFFGGENWHQSGWFDTLPSSTLSLIKLAPRWR